MPRGAPLTHEIGHFLGLRHDLGRRSTQPLCEPRPAIMANDTPRREGQTTGCPSGVLPVVIRMYRTRASKAMFQNFLDYTDDACMNLFTQGQVARMVTVLENSIRRESLLTRRGWKNLSRSITTWTAHGYIAGGRCLPGRDHTDDRKSLLRQHYYHCADTAHGRRAGERDQTFTLSLASNPQNLSIGQCGLPRRFRLAGDIYFRFQDHQDQRHRRRGSRATMTLHALT